jgi:hypothetical protein
MIAQLQVFNFFEISKVLYLIVTTPLRGKCEDEIPTPKSENLKSSGSPENSEPNRKGQILRIDVFFIPLERS